MGGTKRKGKILTIKSIASPPMKQEQSGDVVKPAMVDDKVKMSMVRNGVGLGRKRRGGQTVLSMSIKQAD